jgi:hypothetical protein
MPTRRRSWIALTRGAVDVLVVEQHPPGDPALLRSSCIRLRCEEGRLAAARRADQGVHPPGRKGELTPFTAVNLPYIAVSLSVSTRPRTSAEGSAAAGGAGRAGPQGRLTH